MREQEVRIHIQRLSGPNPQFHTQLVMDKWELSDDNLEQIANELAYSPELLRVSLNNNRFGSRGCISLCKALIVKAPNLQQILVGKNYIQKTGVTALCELLEKMKSMNTLVVNHNPLGDSGVVTLFEAVSRAPHMIYVDLRATFFSPLGAKSIAHLLPQCFGLATLLLDGNPQVGLEGVQLIKAAAVRCSTLKTCSLPALPDANTAQGGGAGVGSSAYNSFSGVPKDSSAEDSGTSRERGAHTSEESPGSGVPGPMTSQSRTDTLQTESKSLMEKASGQAEVLSSVEVA